MCKAGIPVLDVYPMTASYPNGTLDHVHYSDNVQKAAEDQLMTFIADEIERRNWELQWITHLEGIHLEELL